MGERELALGRALWLLAAQPGGSNGAGAESAGRWLHSCWLPLELPKRRLLARVHDCIIISLWGCCDLIDHAEILV